MHIHSPAIQRHFLLALSHQASPLQYTDAIAIFDLLDIHLVHGWLVDPQVMNPGRAHIAFRSSIELHLCPSMNGRLCMIRTLLGSVVKHSGGKC